ncbi:MAG: hypothetical protein LC794_11495 [Acidobacteria bacterium]|nr:hypothetical protein [Acidobacteriota bacterium]MCA1627291.1 hypothetical protein [Acidobacteriota bacterium]
MTTLEKEVRFLKAYAVISTLVFAVLFLTAFTAQTGKQKFAEIDVERINVVEKDGKLRMVISNNERQHPGIVNGKIIERKGPRPPGMIFFNHLGDEMGGLIYGDNGGNGHFGSLTWDRVRGDQTIGFRHLEGDDGKYQMGLEMWQQPNVQEKTDKNESATNRLFLGKYRDNSTVLLMRDIKGKPRIRMQVAPDGTPLLEFLDEAGKVIQSFPTPK